MNALPLTEPNGLVVDLFAGGGGASTGLAWALGRDPDIAINHDAEALAMHAANHPHTRHLLNDITRVLPLEAACGQPVSILHASPDCTHFSRAKGGKPRSQHIRDLAWVVIRWAEDTRPSLITLENVEEFQTWGPLDAAGHPIREHAGDTFRCWVKRLRALGYAVSWRLLRACDYGAPTTRKRLFVVARLDGLSPVWPKPTHGAPESLRVLSGELQPYRTAAECIDWSIECRSIFDRKKPLAANTQRRIAEGLKRYVFKAEQPFFVSIASGNEPQRDIAPVLVTNTSGHAPTDMRAPCPTLTTGGQQIVAGAIVSPNHTADYYTPFRGQNVREPLRTITRAPGFALTVAPCAPKDHQERSRNTIMSPVLSRQFGNSVGQSLQKPHPTITQCNHDMLVSCIAKHYGNGVVGHGMRRPLGTVTTIDHHSLVSARLQDKADSKADGQTAGLSAACMIKYYGTATAAAVENPMPTITSRDRMGLVVAKSGVDSRYETVRDWLRKWNVIGPQDEAEIRHDGRTYRMNDICMRMLAPRELYTAQGFGPDYKIDMTVNGKPLTKTAQVRMCGNSVPPQLVAALVRANGPETWITSNHEPSIAAC